MFLKQSRKSEIKDKFVKINDKIGFPFTKEEIMQSILIEQVFFNFQIKRVFKVFSIQKY